MATKKQLVFTPEEINALSLDGEDITKVMHAVSVLGSDGEGLTPEEITEAKALLVANREELANIWRKYKTLEKLLENFKKAMEVAVGRFTDEEGNIAGFDRQFKWDKPRASTSCTDMAEFYKLATELYGVDPSCFAAKMKALTSKDSAELIGVSEQVLLEAHGDIFATKYSKPALKAV